MCTAYRWKYHWVLGRLLERDHPSATRVQMLGEPLDGTPLAGGVAALEDDDDLQAHGLDVLLQLEQLNLQQPLGRFVLADSELAPVRVVVPPGERIKVR